MAKKIQTRFVCSECGYDSPKWMGQCICGAWNTMVEERIFPDKADSRRRTGSGVSTSGSGIRTSGKPVPLRNVRSGETDRLDTGIRELNRVLGGGLVRGSLTLIAGEPGIGKSTIILQASAQIAAKYGTVLYVSGEESEEQIKMRADRICDTIPEKLLILSETNMEQILLQVEEEKPEFLIIDSIQTMYSEALDSAPGSVSQVRLCGNELMRVGKGRGLPVLLVCHVTKSGDLAGPKIVEHLVDTVLNFTGERSQDLRIIRSQKNRFGTTNEIGAFEMSAQGLIGVENLSENLMQEMGGGSEGSVATAVYEGTRPLLLEVQSLTAPCPAGFPRRTSIGFDSNRLGMILAVLERRAGIRVGSQDVYVNIVGGIRPEGTFSDLAVALAVYSSFAGRAPAAMTLALGEIGLNGELRSVHHTDKIVREAGRMGFRRIILPEKNVSRAASAAPAGLEIIGVRTLADAIEAFNGRS